MTQRRTTLGTMLMANVFGPDLLIVLVVAVVLLFGAGQLPKLARSVGEASKEFKKSQEEAEEQAKAKATPDPAPSSADDKITLSKAELDALLAEREARARRESGTPPSA
jgi:sec-independent protein translocase protein TatA